MRDGETLPPVEPTEPGTTVAPGALSALLREVARAPEARGGWDVALRPGAVFGRFELVREIGRGGFGTVYEARDLELGRSVAFKAVRAIAPAGRDERLIGEAEIAARLSHPNIVVLHDVGRCDHGVYLILELLRGETLAARLRNGPLAPAEALRVAIEIARGLAHAHAHGVVHRDLTPRNVFVCGDGQVKVLDFGLAHVFGRQRFAAGTPGYMAPEQLRGAPEDERTDVFALGAILYQMLTGQPPPPAERSGRKSRTALPPVAAFPGLGELVACMLADDPVERPRDGAEVLSRLASLGQHGALERHAGPSASMPSSDGGARGSLGGAHLYADSEENSIAVLPFVDMSAGRDQGYLCEGLAEELINVLTQVEGLRVAARSSSFQFRGPALDVRDVGHQLRVATLLEGSVRKVGDRLRITVQLIDVGTGYHRWSQRFDRNMDDIFAVQDEIAANVAASLRGDTPVGVDAPKVPPTAVEAYEWYLRGLPGVHEKTRADLDRAREMFERAISVDPAYAPAWAALATVHAVSYEWWGAKDEDLQRAERSAEKALELAPNLADAHVARGFAHALRSRYAEAAREFDDAIRLNPRLFDAYYFYARASFANGEIERSAELFRKAAEVRLEDYQAPILLGQSLCMLGRTEEGREAYREGMARVERALELNPADVRALSLAPGALLEAGEPEKALEWSRRSLELYPDEMTTLVNAACVRARLGMKEESLQILEKVFARGWGKRDWIENDPDYDSLRDEPRFQKLLAQLR